MGFLAFTRETHLFFQKATYAWIGLDREPSVRCSWTPKRPIHLFRPWPRKKRYKARKKEIGLLGVQVGQEPSVAQSRSPR